MSMNSSILLSIATFIYGVASFFYLMALVFKKPKFAKFGRYAAYLGITTLTCGLLFRWFESYSMGIGHAPLSNLYESLVFFAWTVIFIYLVVEKKYGHIFFGAFVLPMAFLAMAYASLSPNIDNSIQPLVPALQSNWLITHVATCFFGYAAFSFSFGLSFAYLMKIKTNPKISTLLEFLPDPYVIDQLNYQMITFGFLFLSVGIITGAVWANSAWGSYWTWDPKETWSLITWFVYAIFLHARLFKNWSGKKAAYISIIGFSAVLFTYFGVNYLHGLHSYAAT